MNIGLALGAGLGTALAACAIRDEEKLKGSLGCKCREKMDATFEDDSSTGHLGCPFHDEEKEEVELRGRTRSGFPGMQPLKPGPFSAFAARARQVRPRMSGRLRRRMDGDGPVPPGYNCQATQEGGVICASATETVGFPPGCPKCPTPNYPGVAAKQTVGNTIIDVPPPPPGAGGEVAGIPILPLAIGGGILALLLLS